MRVSLTRDASNAATARAEVSAEMGDESVVVFAYTVQLVEREGRWEVTDVGGAHRSASPWRPRRRALRPARTGSHGWGHEFPDNESVTNKEQ